MGITRPATTQERTAMRRMVETRYGRLPTCETPSASYVSDKLEECEQNEPHAARMDEILSLDDLEAVVRRRTRLHG